MKRILIAVLLILIALLFLYCAHLDGIVHIKAFAADDCHFCGFLERNDIEADLRYFPQVEIGSMKSIGYELVLNEKLIFGHNRCERRTVRWNVPMNYCPECGRKLK